MAQGDKIPIHGEASPAFSLVKDEFRRNLDERGDLGAACSVYYRGVKVVDLWGGYRDQARTKHWKQDTLVLVFSTTKGMAAMAVSVALSKGLFNLDTPIANYWPEFAQNSKGSITVRQLLSHQAGLCAIDTPINAEIIADLDQLADILARQTPEWAPGKKQGYHYLSLGFYENELIRRTDPKGRSLGVFLQDEICKPLGIEFYIGLPADFPEERIAPIFGFQKSEMLLHMNKLPPQMVLSLLWPRSLSARTLLNPKIDGPAELDARRYRLVEVPAACGIGDARGIAKAYGEFATGGQKLGITEEVMSCLKKPATTATMGSRDEVMKIEMAFSLGFMKPFPSLQFGRSRSAFGCPGAGGSFGFADPDCELGFAYVMNRMGFYTFDDPRERALRVACYKCIEKLAH